MWTSRPSSKCYAIDGSCLVYDLDAPRPGDGTGSIHDNLAANINYLRNVLHVKLPMPPNAYLKYSWLPILFGHSPPYQNMNCHPDRSEPDRSAVYPDYQTLSVKRLGP